MIRTRRFFQRWQNWLAIGMIAFYFALALAAPFISPMNEQEPGIFQKSGKATDMTPRPPTLISPLGTLSAGIDVFHALVWGARDALKFGLTVTFFTATFGIFYGAAAGLAGGRVNSSLMRISDAFLTFPIIAGVVFFDQLMAAAIIYTGGIYFMNPVYGLLVEPNQQSAIQSLLSIIDPLTLTLVLFLWMPYARITNTMVITIRQADFVQAARALGAGFFTTLNKHLIPNSISPAIVLAARDVGAVVILQATFTFIGIGGGSTWGTMLAMGRNWVIGPGGNIMMFWWTYLPVTLAMIFFGIAWNLLGDGLNDALDIHRS